jgi:FkbM family methyltransferase
MNQKSLNLRHNIKMKYLGVIKKFKGTKSSVTEIELKVLRIVSSGANLIIDAGARTDTYFASLKDAKCQAILIEANPDFSRILKKRTQRYSNVIVKNVKISNEIKPETAVTYFTRSQSFDYNPLYGDEESKVIKLETRTVESLIEEAGFDKVDFYKSDIEGYDLMGLMGLGKYLSTASYLQFEMSTHLKLHGRKIEIEDYTDLLEKHFELFVMRDDQHSIWKNNMSSSDLIPFDFATQQKVKFFQHFGEGSNIFAVNKSSSPFNLNQFSIGLLNG